MVSIKALCRRANVERIEVGPKGAVLSFRDNIFGNPEGLIAYIAKHPEGARVRPDMKVVFFDEWETPPSAAQRRRRNFAHAGRDRGEGGQGGVTLRRGGPCGRPFVSRNMGAHKGHPYRSVVFGQNHR